jgi:hypothetical protein
MNLRIPICFCLATLLAAVSAQAQGTFQNLNFEQANIVPIVGNPNYPYAVSVADALPGWTVDYGNIQQTVILYNDPLLGGETTVTLYAKGYPGFVGPILDGNYSVLLQAGVVGGVPTSASISQSGSIPSGTQSLLFEVGNGPLGPPEVLIGAQSVPLTPVGNGANYTIYGGNISAWAGQTEELTLAGVSPTGGLITWDIDDISFSTQMVPEPSPLVLTGLGAIAFALYRRFAPKRP